MVTQGTATVLPSGNRAVTSSGKVAVRDGAPCAQCCLRFHYGVLRGGGLYDQYGSTFESLLDPPIGIETISAAEGNLRAGELVVITENAPTGRVASKFFRHASSYDVPAGLVGVLMIVARDPETYGDPTRCVVESTSVIQHFDDGENDSSVYLEFDFLSWHGVSFARVSHSTAVLIDGSWNLATVTASHATRLEAFLAAAGGTPSTLGTPQDSISLGAPDATPSFAIGVELARGVQEPTVTFNPSGAAIDSDYRFLADRFFPFGDPDLGVLADRLDAVVSAIFRSTDGTEQPGHPFFFNRVPMVALFPGILSLLPSIPYFQLASADETCALGWYYAELTAQGYFTDTSITPNRLYPGISVARAMPAGSPTATGTYTVLPRTTGIGNSGGGAGALSVQPAVFPREATVS